MSWSLAAVPSVAGAQSTVVLLWSAEGALEDGDKQDEAGAPYDDHSIHLEAGQRYRISACAAVFDTMIRIFPSGGGAAVAENDDDPLGRGVDAGVFYVPQAAGDFAIRVSGFSADFGGPYAVSVEEIPAQLTFPSPSRDTEPACAKMDAASLPGG